MCAAHCSPLRARDRDGSTPLIVAGRGPTCALCSPRVFWPTIPPRRVDARAPAYVQPVATVSATSVSECKPIGETMTTKSDFSAEEWQLILEAPPSAGMIVVTAQRGGMFRETIAMAKAYAEARRQQSQRQLLDEIVSANPERDHTHYHSPGELKQHGLQHLRESVEV